MAFHYMSYDFNIYLPFNIQGLIMLEPISFFGMNAWRRSVGMSEYTMDQYYPDIATLRVSEWSDEFEDAMHVRMVMGAFRYGRLNAAYKPEFDRLSSIRDRIKLYYDDRNDEHLVDIANLCLCEYVEGKHPKKHWDPLPHGDHTTMKPTT